MEEQKIVIEKAVEIGAVTIVPVVQLHSYSCEMRGGSSVLCIRKPLYILTIRNSVKQAFRISGEEISLKQLAQECPETIGRLETN
jgi:hypothetical protein